MKYELVLFDFDGTLADSFPWFSRALDGVTDHFGRQRLSEAERQELRDLAPQEILDRLGVPLFKVPVLAHQMRQRMAADSHNIELFPGTVALLDRLRDAGIRTALVTSNSLENVRVILGPRAELIDHYACGSSLFGKPAKIRRILGSTGVSPARVILVGDEIRDARAARSAGVAFGAVSWGYNSLKALLREGPDEVFESHEQMAAYLSGQNSGAAPLIE